MSVSEFTALDRINEVLRCAHNPPCPLCLIAMEIDGNEALAATLDWLASLVRLGFIEGVSLELSNGKGRLSVRVNAQAPPGLARQVEVAPLARAEQREPGDG